MSLIVTLVRHGETDWNRARRFQGHTDVPLNATGHDQAARLAARLGDEGFAPDVLLTSDLARAHATARPFAEVLGRPAEPSVGWRERSMGCFEGRTRDQVRDELPEAFAAWQRDRAAFRPEGGESYVELRERVGEQLEVLAARHRRGEVAVVTHGGCIYAAVSIAQDVAMPDSGFRIGNTSVTRLVRVGPWRWDIELLNCSKHL